MRFSDKNSGLSSNISYLTNYRPTNQNPIVFLTVKSTNSRKFEVCYGLNVCVSPKFICWNLNAQCDGIRILGLSKVIRLWSGVGLILWMRLVLLKKRPHRVLESFLSCEDTARSLQAGRGLSATMLAPQSQTSSIQNWEK